MDTLVFLDDVVLSERGQDWQLLRKISELSIFGRLVTFWKLIGKHLLYLVLVNIVSCFLKWIRVAVCWFVRQLSKFLDFLNVRAAVFMPNRSQLTHLSREVEVLRRRVELLGNLLGMRRYQNPVGRIAEPAVGIPAVRVNHWQLVLAFIAGLWCGCIVSLLALCIGVKIGHSL